tara:strand:- start:383 stop:1246 length:864 start_codon:yes stop_codon:yes gene_type:complete
MNIIQNSIGEIPFTKYDFKQKNELIFLHANAFPPNCYIPLFRELGNKFNIICPHFRPLWANSGSPEILLDWSPLKDDMIKFLEKYGLENYNLLGHSLGGHIAFRIAIENPKLVNNAILMDPIIFPRLQMFIWKIIQWTQFGVKLHPMIQSSKNQKMIHDSIEELLNKYRTKKIFKKINDKNLEYLISGLTKKTADGRIKIAFPKDWELRIYQAGGGSDKYIWRNVKNLKRNILLIHAGKTHAPDLKIVNKIKNKSNFIDSKYLADNSHFFPFEMPIELNKLINNFLI